MLRYYKVRTCLNDYERLGGRKGKCGGREREKGREKGREREKQSKERDISWWHPTERYVVSWRGMQLSYLLLCFSLGRGADGGDHRMPTGRRIHLAWHGRGWGTGPRHFSNMYTTISHNDISERDVYFRATIQLKETQIYLVLCNLGSDKSTRKLLLSFLKRLKWCYIMWF